MDSFATFADTMVVEVLDGLAIERASIVSTSLGGYCSLRMAAAHPDRVDTAVHLEGGADVARGFVPRFGRNTGRWRRSRTATTTSTRAVAWPPCGYDTEVVNALPDIAVESFAGVANPFALRDLQPGERVMDVGSGAGFDSFLASDMVGPTGRAVGVDMTPEMLGRSRRTAEEMGSTNVEFRDGLCEDLPVEDQWADVVIANGVLNLVAAKQQAFAEIRRALKPGGILQFADIAKSQPVPEEAIRDIDLWTA